MSDNPQPEPTPQPYGSPPNPGPNPYNQPGYGHTQGQTYTGVSGPSRAKSQRTCMVLVIVFLLLSLLVLGGIGLISGFVLFSGPAPTRQASTQSSSDPTDSSADPSTSPVAPTANNTLPPIGGCLKITATSGTYSSAPADCNAPFVTYTLTEVSETGRCVQPYEPLQVTQHHVPLTLCLMVNLTEGKCYGDVGDKLFTEMACTDPQAKAKIVKRIDNSDDDSSCDASLVFRKDPGRVYCLENP